MVHNLLLRFAKIYEKFNNNLRLKIHEDLKFAQNIEAQLTIKHYYQRKSWGLTKHKQILDGGRAILVQI